MNRTSSMAATMHYDAIINGSSGGALGGRIAKIRDRITGGLGHQLRKLMVLKGTEIGEAVEDWKRHNGNPDEALMLAGGDGTFNRVAAQFLDTPHILAPVPTGTFNLVMGRLGVSMDLKKAVESFKNPELVQLQAASVNGHPFFANVVFDELSQEALNAREALRIGNIFAASAHIGKTLSSAMTEQPLSVKVHFDGRETERLGRSFMVTNGRLAYPEEVRAEPVEGKLLRRAVPFLRLRADESNLNFYNFGSGTRAGFLRAAHKIAANDDWQTDADVGRTSAQKITIAPANDDDLGRPLKIMVDAETVETAWPLDIRFGTGSVNVLTPSQALR